MEGQNTDDFVVFKFLLVGDSGTGKSCMLLRFVDDTFSASFATTIGIDFKIKTVKLSSGQTAKLQIWDTAGQERFRTITSAYYRSTRAVLVVYDITNKQTFDHVPEWMEEVRTRTDKNPLKVLVGTKCDLATQRTVGSAEGKALAQTHGYDFVETSSKTDSKGINAMFMGLAEKLMKQDQQQEAEEQKAVVQLAEQQQDEPTEKKKGCC